jgi:hypothetical protein
VRNIEGCEGYKKLLAAVEYDEAHNSKAHDYRAKLAWVVDRAKHYAERTGLDASDILDKWEEGRPYWYMNYYQDCEQPLLDEKVRVFNILFAFPSDWTSDQVMKALDFANEAFERGIRYGRSDKAYEVRRALGISS